MENYIYGINNYLGADEASLEGSVYAFREYIKEDFLVLNESSKENIPYGRTENRKLKHLDPVRAASEEVFKFSDGIIKENKRPVIFAGDHAIALGTVSGASNNYDNLGLLWIDAHGDINTEETTITGNIHGMPISFLLGYGSGDLSNIGGFKGKIKAENILYLGLRDLDYGEVEIIERLKINYISYDDFVDMGMEEAIRRVNEFFKGKYLHISFDFDSLDPKIFPGVSVPVLDGFNKEDIEGIFEGIIGENKVTSFDFVEFNKNRDVDNRSLEYAKTLFEKVLGLLEKSSF